MRWRQNCATATFCMRLKEPGGGYILKGIIRTLGELSLTDLIFQYRSRAELHAARSSRCTKERQRHNQCTIVQERKPQDCWVRRIPLFSVQHCLETVWKWVEMMMFTANLRQEPSWIGLHDESFSKSIIMHVNVSLRDSSASDHEGGERDFEKCVHSKYSYRLIDIDDDSLSKEVVGMAEWDGCVRPCSPVSVLSAQSVLWCLSASAAVLASFAAPPGVEPAAYMPQLGFCPVSIDTSIVLSRSCGWRHLAVVSLWSD